MRELQGENGTDTGRGQSGKNGDGVDVTLVQDAKNDVNRGQSSQNEDGLTGQGTLKGGSGALKAGADGGRKVNGTFGTVYELGSLAERDSGGEIERDGHRRILALVAHRQRRIRGTEVRKGSQRHRSSVGSAHVDVLQGFGSVLKLRRHLHYHVVLVELAVHDGDLALSESVVKRGINGGGIYSEAGSGVAVND